jgi:hypothetical protein
MNMAGKNIAWKKELSFNVTRLAGLTTTIIGTVGSGEDDADTVGIVRGDSETWRQMPDAIMAQSDFDINRSPCYQSNSLVRIIVMAIGFSLDQFATGFQ